MLVLAINKTQFAGILLLVTSHKCCNSYSDFCSELLLLSLSSVLSAVCNRCCLFGLHIRSISSVSVVSDSVSLGGNMSSGMLCCVVQLEVDVSLNCSGL